MEPSGKDFDRDADRAAAQLRAIPQEQPVRLAKKTSNLFRAREQVTARLDLDAFNGVYHVDPATATASVGGLTTYEDLVAATLPHGLVPLCVPQLRTITLGGAVTGLGIEAASFRNGLPHESVRSMDVLTATGEVLKASRDENSDLFFGFANSYGSLGYALRLEIELEPVTPYVGLRHLRFADVRQTLPVIAEIIRTRQWQGERVDYLDGTVFSAEEQYLTLGTYTSDRSHVPSDYTGRDIYYRSIQQRSTDLLTTLDYLWRWDTDWFWCSRALGVQKPWVRPFWPRRYKRSDVYWKIIDLDRKYQLAARADRLRGHPARESVVQDVEVPLEALPEFLSFFHDRVGISPVWLCPLKQRDADVTWSLYQFDPELIYVNVGFWSTVSLKPGEDPEAGRINREIEAEVTRLGGRKSLYSTAFYERDDFYDIYGHGVYGALKDEYDPNARLTGLWEKTVAGR
ncbi:MAG: FAD-binding oxidoreductase [Actinobacteria bacterium]|nr:FAD-binding oxidoreductase [Actinomycetota bacterium]